MRKFLLIFFVIPILAGRAEGQSIHFVQTLSQLSEAVAFNPLAHGQIVYAALRDSEGIYKSYDGGYHWQHLFGGPNPLELGSSDEIGQIYILSSDTSVMLVGSQNARYGLYRSSDGGYNWKRVIEDVASEGQTIFEKPDRSNQGHDTIFFGESVTGHLWRSTDKGVTWDSLKATVGQPSLCTIVIDPSSSETYLAGAAGGAICRTTDGGKSWDTTHPSEPSGNADVPRIQFDPKTPLRVWATVFYYPNESLLRSDDGGKTWQTRTSPPDEWAFDLDPSNPNRLWMGRFSGLHIAQQHFDQSTDGGATWTDEGLDSVVDIWVIKYDSASGRLAVATSSGVYMAEVGKSSVAVPATVIAGVYPNPAAHTITINSDANKFQIIDLLGRTVWTHGMGRASLNIASWPNGVYSLLEQRGHETKISRFVINH